MAVWAFRNSTLIISEGPTRHHPRISQWTSSTASTVIQISIAMIDKAQALTTAVRHSTLTWSAKACKQRSMWGQLTFIQRKIARKASHGCHPLSKRPSKSLHPCRVLHRKLQRSSAWNTRCAKILKRKVSVSMVIDASLHTVTMSLSKEAHLARSHSPWLLRLPRKKPPLSKVTAPRPNRRRILTNSPKTILRM